MDSSLLDLRRLPGLQYLVEGIDRALEAESSELRRHLVHALVHDQIGSEEAAVESLDAALRLDPSNPLGIALKADYLARGQRLDEALELLGQQRRGRQVEWFSESTLGAVLWMNGDHDAALEHFLAATKDSPRNALPYARLAEALRLLEDYQASLAAFKTATAMATQSAFLLERLADVNRILYLLPDALEALTQAEQIEGLTAFGWGTRADILRQGGDFEAAEQAYNEALARDPNDAFAKSWRAHVQYQLGRDDEALEGIEAAVDLDPTLYTSWVIKAIVLRQKKRYREAGESVATALQLATDPQDPWLVYWSALLHYEIGETEASIPEFKLVLSKDPTDELTGRLLARALLETGKFPEGLEVAQKAASGHNADGWTLSTVGDAWASAGNRKEAEKAYTRARARLQEGPPAADDGWLEGWLLLHLRQYDEALAALIDELGRSPDETGLDLDLALATLCSGRIEAGIAEYYRAVASAHQREEPGRLKGLLATARFDLQMSSRFHNISSSTQLAQVFELLESSTEGERVIDALWVDDKPTNNLAEMKNISHLLGVEFTTALDTDEAIATLKSNPGRFPFVISDMARGLDRRAGLTLLRKMRELGIERPTIIYAASASPEREAEARRHGAFGMTNSPSHLHDLIKQILRELIDSTQAASQPQAEVEPAQTAR